MEQQRYRFDPKWALAAMVVGLLAVAAYSVGSRHVPDLDFVASGVLMGLSIYTANNFLHAKVGCHLAGTGWPAPIQTLAGIALTIVGGVVGWLFAFVVASLLSGGTVHPRALLRHDMRWLFMVTMVITILFGLFAHTYEEMRRHLSSNIERLKAHEYAEKELEVARAIQSRLLPPPMVRGDGFVITARNIPAHMVAGDFYDVIRHEDGSVGVVVADVAGKGIGASLIMASVKAVLPFIANGRVDETLGALNERLLTQLDRREFVALAYARFQPATGMVSFANAGMPDPYLVGSSVRSIEVAGPRLPLGLRGHIAYQCTDIQMSRGDRLLLLSDGIPEAQRPGGDPLGYDSLREMITALRQDDDTWIDALLTQVRAQVQGVDDDWTAVVLQRR